MEKLGFEAASVLEVTWGFQRQDTRVCGTMEAAGTTGDPVDHKWVCNALALEGPGFISQLNVLTESVLNMGHAASC